MTKGCEVMQESCKPARSAAGIMLGVLLLAMSLLASARAEARPFFVAAYAGKAAEERMLDILTRYNTGFRDAWLLAVAPGLVLRDHGSWRQELEGQLVRHFGDQSHWELNAAWLARWQQFPWNDRLATRAALGLGVSWATEIPPIEPRAKLDEGESRQFLGYVAIELELAPPGEADWSGFIRLHHRSDAFGLFHDQRGGSNFITLGLRRRL